jgi:hypothetical protein
LQVGEGCWSLGLLRMAMDGHKDQPSIHSTHKPHFPLTGSQVEREMRSLQGPEQHSVFLPPLSAKASQEPHRPARTYMTGCRFSSEARCGGNGETGHTEPFPHSGHECHNHQHGMAPSEQTQQTSWLCSGFPHPSQ